LPILSAAYTFCVSHTRNPLDGTTTTLILTGKPTDSFGNVPSGLTVSIINDRLVLSWTANTDRTTVGYKIYLNDVLLDTVGLITTYYYGDAMTAGTYDFSISSIDSYGSESTDYAANTFTIHVPNTPNPSAIIVDKNAVVTWTDCKSDISISYYTVNGVKVGNTLSWSERITGTGEKTYTVVAYDLAGNASAAGTDTVTVTALNQPSAITTAGLIYACKLNVAYVYFDGFEALEIWSSKTNDRTAAVMIAELPNGHDYTHTGLDLVDTRYYWARCRDYLGNYGLWYPEGATSGVAGSSSSDPTDYLTVLTGSLTESQLYHKLTERIDLIDKAVSAWASGTAYAVGDIILKDDVYYRCKVAHTNHVPPNATYWDVISDGLINEWTVKLTAAGKVAGVGMMMDPTSGASEFIILSDKFQVVDPSDTGTPKTIFTVGNINGTSAVGIKGDLIIDGSLAVNRLASGIIHGKQITLGYAGGPGTDDTYIASGKTDFTTTNAGFILGRDYSGGNKAKFYIGDTDNYMYWDGEKLVCNMLGDFKTSDTYPRVELNTTSNIMEFTSAGDYGERDYVTIGGNDNTYESTIYASRNSAQTGYVAIIDCFNVGTHATGSINDKYNIAVRGITQTTKSSGTPKLVNIGVFGEAYNGTVNYGVWSRGDLYVEGNGYAEHWYTYSPHFDGDAIAEIKKIKGVGGKIDHATLPTFVSKRIKKAIKVIDEKGEPILNTDGSQLYDLKEVDGQDIGNMMSMLTVAVQQLTDRIEKLETKS
jgi:hypothetical protein